MTLIMKKVFIHLFVLGLILGFAASAQAQPPYASVDIGDESGYVGSTILVPVMVNFDQGEIVRSFEFRIDFSNGSIVNFLGEINVEAIFGTVTVATDGENPPSDLVIFWESGGTDDAEEFSGKLLDLEFEILGEGVCDLMFISRNVVGENEIGGGVLGGEVGADPFESEFIDGSVTGIAPPIPLKNWSLILGLVLISGFLAARLNRIL
jgi:hypothetical protein